MIFSASGKPARRTESMAWMVTRGSASRSAPRMATTSGALAVDLALTRNSARRRPAIRNLRVGDLQRAQDEFVIERAETLERPQRVQARAGIGGVAAS